MSHAVVRHHGPLLIAAAALCALARWTEAAGIQVGEVRNLSIPDRRDIAFDANGTMYVSAGGSVVRYDTRTGEYLPSFELGGSLIGLDISPDGRTLAVADGSVTAGRTRVHLVALQSGTANQITFNQHSLESGTFMVAWGADGRLLTTSSFAGSGSVPLRRYDPATGVSTEIANVQQNTMLTPSADRWTIGYAESNLSSGPAGRYDVASGTLGASANTTWFTFEIGVARDGSQFAVPTYSGTFIYDGSFDDIHMLGSYAGEGPIGVVYSPLEDVLYTAWYDWNKRNGGVKAFDADTFEFIANYDDYQFSWNGNHALREGRIEIAPDAQALAVTVSGGVHLIGLPPVPEPAALSIVAAAATLMVRRRRRPPSRSQFSARNCSRGKTWYGRAS